MSFGDWLKSRWQRTDEMVPAPDSRVLMSQPSTWQRYLARVARREKWLENRRALKRVRLSRTRMKRRRARLREKLARKVHRGSAGPQGFNS